jgi:uncharacterized repeat protein (TIGR04076 family)
MAQQEKRFDVGHRLVATIKSVKGVCHWNHKPGDSFEISAHDTAGLCGFFYHDIFPYIVMLQFGGGFEEGGEPDSVELECLDKMNAVTIELRRVRD